jgi:hypothetical protein
MLTDLDYELLSAYIDGALTESERAAFERRLQTEPELSHELDELRATVTLLNNLPALKAPRDFTLDARYARRSSFFFTSAAFSALSTAAAVILFALGAYVLTVNKAPTSAPTSGGAAQSAFAFTATGSTLDKAAATTATEPLANEMQVSTNTPLNSPIVPPEGVIANDALIQPSPTIQPSSLPDQSPFLHADTAQPTGTLGEAGDSNSSAAASAPSDMQRRTDEATQTSANQEYAEPGSDGTVNGAVPAPSMAQAIPSTQVTEEEASTSMGFAATQLPFTATVLPTASATLTPSLTLTLSPTLTASPTLTLSPTLTPSATLTETATPQPTATSVPLVFQPPVTAPDSLPLVLIALGIVFLLVAIATTVIRRRNRS